MVLGGLYFYVQNKKQAALLPAFGHVVATLAAPLLTPLAAMTAPASRAVVAQAPQAAAQTIEPAAGDEAARPMAAAQPQ